MMWSIVQQMSTKRLCDSTGKNEGTIIPVYRDRAERIAATYARLYLETEDYGDISKKGRFYWMALGAFASKTVACSLCDTRVALIGTVFKGLAKGNLWLFMISADGTGIIRASAIVLINACQIEMPPNM